MSKIIFSTLIVCLFAVLVYAGEVIQTQESDSWEGIQCDLTSVKVKDDIITLKFKLRNAGKEKQSVKIMFKECYIMDQKNQKKYFVLKDSDGMYIGGPNYDNNDGGRFWFDILPEKSNGIWMKFPVPVDATEEIAVSIPGMPPFEDVKLEK
ncbi:MAG: hypothetical protein A2161_11195 [Candidatus Schekmanbacteria bacterium RBG_13_48_7]|uniref:DUF4352 domain-containing protein n=1 Tax=Candidatus Schekmanbacteria bacterium RBG_13_48_7 TaxID=1817878 RepID=A0A1F7S4Z4_9BACT|nr:MAG: hypothetical protein A2161_11195 [Candidatus Schekmanbacteria bacterium RBG_13_48_7]